MASVASQLIEEVTARAQSDSLEDAREICADGTYFPNSLRTNQNLSIASEVFPEFSFLLFRVLRYFFEIWLELLRNL